jgi:CheY-like chemotaxis protein
MSFDRASKPSQPSTVLCVEDNPFLIEAFSELFKAEGYNVLSATTNSEAKEKLVAKDIDLVLIPLMLVADDFVQSGKSKVELFQDENVDASIHKVLITIPGVPLFEEVILFLEQAGVENVHFIKHPFSSEKLTKITRQLLNEEKDKE